MGKIIEEYEEETTVKSSEMSPLGSLVLSIFMVLFGALCVVAYFLNWTIAAMFITAAIGGLGIVIGIVGFVETLYESL